ncbi:hypothetical protein BDV40DRAFT_167144 [Aspergillus tamarii]|uniref:Uncharacterized protein n=1 Tax=Aspergillus tamarii TaxID=41984 RepID=A0A5N6UUC6_ASPTM|nr:hypothetical protein BDV40DRAFT_167144 [Aspergillus tamarii]
MDRLHVPRLNGTAALVGCPWGLRAAAGQNFQTHRPRNYMPDSLPDFLSRRFDYLITRRCRRITAKIDGQNKMTFAFRLSPSSAPLQSAAR